MCPVLLLFLLLGALKSESTTMSPENNAGQNFIVAFPENIAYYHPDEPQNKVKVTALYDDTEVKIGTDQRTLSRGQTHEIVINKDLELRRENISNKILQITSNNKITVHAINRKNNSVQTTLVIPIDNLGKKYLIPPVPEITGTTHPEDGVTTAVAERGPFKLVIINGDENNVVTVTGQEFKDIQSHQVAQIWLKKEEALTTVVANHPVAVLFGHTCAIRYNCTCGQLYTMLLPDKEEEQEFYVPPALVSGAESETVILLSKKGEVKPFQSDKPLVKTTGTAILYRPGLLLNLIPKTDFAACLVVNIIPDAQNSAVIVVHKDQTDGVHVGSLPLVSPEWQQLKGTDYVSTSVNVMTKKTVIWHSSSQMAVYLMGNKEGALFGNPAAIISKTPDFRGCTLSPEVVKIGEVADGWRESLKYCRDNGMDLGSFPEAQLQTQIYSKIMQANNDGVQNVWIGMRRSSLTGEWYWLSGKPVNDTNWAEGEPGTVQDGQCAIMSLEHKKDFGWSDEDCCKDAYPVCYSSPVFFPAE
ncbi:IgGFc-binding protein-like [Dicentrarchus labrax]|uniref:IgGFc-binding protein-like n=1 Tax=Dicentrarchus labrax TaxID=13489 RepID=UPI0021F5E7C5|nr:IgGFc-binding protein-like [Dicentrarchus labrax]